MSKKTIKCLGAKALSKMGITARYNARNKSVLILMFHRVNSDPDCLGLTISPGLFSHQLKFLKENYDVISLGEAVSRISSGLVTENSCAITFDDGYRDNYQIAVPLLSEHKIPATIFITYDAILTGHFGWGAFDRTVLSTRSDLLDLQCFELGQYRLTNKVDREMAVVTLHRLLKQRPDVEKRAVVEYVVVKYGGISCRERSMMNWSEVTELAHGGLVTIGAHTVTHPILSRITLAQARHEIVEGKRLIEQYLGQSVDYFAYPNGQPLDIGHQVVNLVNEAGYLGACTTIAGRNPVGSDPFFLKRIDATSDISTDCEGQFSPELFDAMTSGLLYRK